MRGILTHQIAFSDLCKLIAATFAALTVILLIWPAVVHWLFQIGSDPATDVISRRAGVLFAGLTVLVWGARSQSDSPLRRSVCLSICVAMAGMALLGAVEFLRGAVGFGVWIAITVEVYFAVQLSKYYRGAA